MITETHEVPLSDRTEPDTQLCDSAPFRRASSTMLSRLAEAVDGARIGTAVCYVGRFWYRAGDQGHRLFGPFRDCTEAANYRDKAGLSPEDY